MLASKRVGMTSGRLAWCTCLLVAAALVPAPAAAQSPADKAAAEALFDEGKKHLEAGELELAVKKFEASQKLDAGVGTLLYLADAYERSGRVASAWITFREAAYSARSAGQPDREQIGKARAAALEPKLFRLRINAPADPPPGLEIKRNGAVVAREAWGSGVPVDPGRYVIEASAPGKKPWTGTTDVPAGPGASALDVPALEALPIAAPVAPVPPPPAAAPVAPAAPPDATSDGSTQRIAGGIVAGVGVVSLAVGGVLVGEALSKDGEADEHCDGTVCRDAEGAALSQDARSLADISTLFVGVGAAAIVGGVILFLTAPSGKPAPASASGQPAPASGRVVTVAPAIGARSGGVMLGGRF